MILKNCKVKWAKLIKPDEMSGKWSIRVYLNPEQIAAVSQEGITTKSDDDGHQFITPSRKPVSSKGATIAPPRVVDIDRKPFTGAIGNGSICNVIVNFYDWKFGKETGRGAWLEAVQVVELKEYVGKEDFDVPEGAEVNEDSLPF